MKESEVLKLALICSLLGLLALFFVSEGTSIDKVDINKITGSDIGKIVKAMGSVEKVSNSANITFITLTQAQEIEVVLFKSLNFSKGDYVEVIGEVEEYKGKKEIIGNAVRVIS